MIVGVGTTIINYGVYFLCNVLGGHYLFSNTVAWAAAITFSYFVNGSWVYQSTSHRSWREAMAFVSSRVFSLGLETVLLFFFVNLWGVGQYLSKILVSIVVVIINYWTGLLVYKKGRS